mmetsp:Transcript_12880/g.17416  ORF Transcript_12880/g.17416 Transcript_12880/m.17416 type:complete len:109 (+) Transcript_12880:261-587(+)
MRQCPDNFDETRFILIRLEVASNTPLHPMNTSMQSGKTNIRVSLMQDSLERLGHHVRMLYRGTAINKRNGLIFNQLSNKMQFNINVLGSRLDHRVVCNVNSLLIVLIN